jgi:hypothetical protein
MILPSIDAAWASEQELEQNGRGIPMNQAIDRIKSRCNMRVSIVTELKDPSPEDRAAFMAAFVAWRSALRNWEDTKANPLASEFDRKYCLAQAAKAFTAVMPDGLPFFAHLNGIMDRMLG